MSLEKLTAHGHVEHVSSTVTLAAAQSRQEVLETPKNQNFKDRNLGSEILFLDSMYSNK